MNNNMTDELLLLFLNYEFSKLNLYLTEKQLNSFVKQLNSSNINSITFSFKEEQLSDTKYCNEEDTAEDISKILANKNKKLENFMKLSADEMAEYSHSLASRIAGERLSLLYKETPDYLRELRKGNILVKKSIDEIWGAALDLFELLIDTAISITTNNDMTQLENYEENIDLYEALSRLQCRACLLSNEILVLLRAGFPDGAYARCRTLYETMIISCFINENGNETAKRYLDYSIVNDLKKINNFNKYNEIVENNLTNEKEIIELKKEVSQLKTQYGETFTKGDYNWALNIIKLTKNQNQIKFWQIEAQMDFKNMKQFHKLASDSIHTSSSSLYSHIGLSSEESHHLLMGASDLGVEKSCSLASHLITITTSNLILHKAETTESLIQISLLNQIRRDLQECLNEIEIEVYK